MSLSKDRRLYERIYAIVRLIPRGRVATYGQVAAYVSRCTPRQVGYAMAALPYKDVPWQRVINSKGMISFPPNSRGAMEQRGLLEVEGIMFDRSGRVDLRRFGWAGPLEEGREQRG
jgi:methylated-DNA-protein-cysteine methyltransferase-like protein